MKRKLHRHCSSDNFVRIPNETVRESGLSPAALGLLVYLLSHDETFEHWRNKVMDDLEIKMHTYQKLMKELEDKGFVLRSRGGAGGGANLHVTDTKNGLSDVANFRTSVFHDIVKNKPHKKTKHSKKTNIKPRQQAASGQKVPEKVKIPKPPTASYPDQMEMYSRRWFKRSTPMGMSAEDVYYWLVQKRTEALA